MNLESKTIKFSKSQEETYKLLNNIENFKSYMPDNMVKFEMPNADTFVFSLKGMPEITLKRKEAHPFHKIVLGSEEGKLNFSLTAHINELSASESQVKLQFDGAFNPMMAMMIKGPITKFLDTLTSKMEELV